MAKRKLRIRKASAETSAARRDALQRKAVNDVAAVVGVPDAQRGHHAVKIVPTAVDGEARPIARTLCKLTRVERLQRSGAIDARHARAIGLYVDAADNAYAGCGSVASYGEGGGSSPTGAAAAAHGRMLDRVGASYALDAARAALPAAHVTAFDRVVLDNHPVGLVGADMWPGASAGSVSASIRDLVRTCADLLAIHYGIAGPADQRTSLLRTMQRLDAAVRAEQAGTPTLDAITPAVLAARAGDALYACPIVAADIAREAGLDAVPGHWVDLPLIVVEHWQFGWMVQPAPKAA